MLALQQVVHDDDGQEPERAEEQDHRVILQEPSPAMGVISSGTDTPICQDTRSRSQVCGVARSVVCHHALKDLAGEKAFETADDLPFGPPFSGASFDVVEGW